jgi:hypothetical protein
MKKIFYLLFVFPLLFSCGEDASSNEKSGQTDAERWCECMGNMTTECEKFTDDLTKDLKEDWRRKEAFWKAVEVECGDEMRRTLEGG